MARELLADLSFAAEVIEWRGPAPFVFAAIPGEHTGELHYAARLASYGWGVVPVTATIRGIAFETSLFPRDGNYLLPLKLAVRRQADITVGEVLAVAVEVYAATAVRK